MLLAANDLKYIKEIKNLLEGEFASPTPEFVRFVLGTVYNGLKTQQVIEQFTPIVKQAITLLINGRINDRLKSALSIENAVDADKGAIEEPPQEEVSGIVTTELEMEALYIIRAILHEVIDVSRVTHRDTKSYFGILLDDNNRKPICRLHFNTSQKYVGIIDKEKIETRIPIQSLNEIYGLSGRIKDTLDYYEPNKQK